jgi:hypothetical protein
VIANLLFLALGVAVTINFGSLVYKIWLVRRESGEAWRERQEQNASELDGLDEPAYRRAYFRAYGPLGSIHAYVALALAALLTPPALIAYGAAWRLGWRLAGSPATFQPGYLVWQFYLFFALIASWAVVAGVVMRRHHRHRARELKYELARERERASKPA